MSDLTGFVTNDTAPQTMTRTEWADDLLTLEGWPVSPNAEQSVVGWELGEGGAGPQWGTDNLADFNPVNTTQVEPGSLKVNSDGVQAYTSWGQGLAATVQTLNQDQRGYANIRADLANGASVAQTNADVDASAWGTHDLPTNGASPAPSSASSSASDAFSLGQIPSAIPDAIGSLLGVSGVGSTVAKAGIVIVGVLAGAGLVVLGAYKSVGSSKQVQAVPVAGGGASPAAGGAAAGGLPIEAAAAA